MSLFQNFIVDSKLWSELAPVSMGYYHLKQKSTGIECIGYLGPHGWGLISHGGYVNMATIGSQFWFGARVYTAQEQYAIERK